MKRSLHWLGAVALAAAAPLAAAVQQTEAMPSFSSVDEDKDGYISVQEASTVPAIQFSSADKDGDRRLSPDEYTAAGGRDADETDEEGPAPGETWTGTA